MKKTMNPYIRLILDIAPLALFFISYRLYGLMTATAVLIAATLISLFITWLLERKIALTPLISGVLVAMFGGLTLALNDSTFIKMKPTLVNLLFAAILLGGLALKKPLLKYLMETAFQLTQRGWYLLSLRWALFFISLAALNEFIWRSFSEEFWVEFKVFGMLPLTLTFALLQIPLIKRHTAENTAE